MRSSGETEKKIEAIPLADKQWQGGFRTLQIKFAMSENELATIIIGHAIDIHRVLGPGLLENAYRECLFYRISKTGIAVRKEVPIPIYFEEIKLECGYRADLIVDDKVIVETKAIAELADVHAAQVLTYLKFSGKRLGLLINFNELRLKDGIRRVANRL